MPLKNGISASGDASMFARNAASLKERIDSIPLPISKPSRGVHVILRAIHRLHGLFASQETLL